MGCDPEFRRELSRRRTFQTERTAPEAGEALACADKAGVAAAKYGAV